MCHMCRFDFCGCFAGAINGTDIAAHPCSMAVVRLRGGGAGTSVGEAQIEVEDPTPTTTPIPPRHPFPKLR